MNLSQTAFRAINAYGGSDLWTSHKFIEAEVSAKGLAFTIKQRPFFENVKIKMEIARPFSKITPIGKDKNLIGILDGNDVRLENVNGEIIKERKNAKYFFFQAVSPPQQLCGYYKPTKRDTAQGRL